MGNIYCAYYTSPIGEIKISSDENCITGLDFIDEKEEKHDENLTEVLKDALNQLDEYFKGKRKQFDLKLKINGTEFQNKVWKELVNVPYGETRTYKDIAEAVNNPKACRAVGGANNRNRIAIIIPCYRIIGNRGRMVGYAGGLWRKEWLLQHENKNK